MGNKSSNINNEVSVAAVMKLTLLLFLSLVFNIYYFRRITGMLLCKSLVPRLLVVIEIVKYVKSV